MAHAPALYNPDPEIFGERSRHNDDYIWPDQVYTWPPQAVAVKTLANHANPAVPALLCGSGRVPAADNAIAEAGRGWFYVNGPVRCVGEPTRAHFGLAQFIAARDVKLDAGWSTPEQHGGDWDGVWSDGNRSRLTVLPAPGMHPATLALEVRYLDPGRRTRVSVNGVDLGWHRLDLEGPLALPAAARQGPLAIELEHEAPRAPGPNDGRALAIFLRTITLNDAVRPAR